MADDTRQPDEQSRSSQPKGPANIMPGGMTHTAGGKAAEAANDLSYFEVVKSLGPDYYLNFHKRPCVRDSQLTGIGAGFVGGSVAAIIGSEIVPFPFPFAGWRGCVWWRDVIFANVNCRTG